MRSRYPCRYVNRFPHCSSEGNDHRDVPKYAPQGPQKVGEERFSSNPLEIVPSIYNDERKHVPGGSQKEAHVLLSLASHINTTLSQ